MNINPDQKSRSLLSFMPGVLREPPPTVPRKEMWLRHFP